MNKHSPFKAARPETVARLLKSRYADYGHQNKANPLNELLFILCSVTTTEPVYLQTYKGLRAAFPRHSDFMNASIRDIAEPIRGGGQHLQKATAIKSIMHELASRFGRPTLTPLKRMSDGACEEFLMSLPRVGKKVARCVMMYSLNRKVFPVDTHCRRIAHRLGWLAIDDLNDDDALQSWIPKKYRYSLHVNMISLGREFCGAKNPKCDICPLSKICPKVSVPGMD